MLLFIKTTSIQRIDNMYLFNICFVTYNNKGVQLFSLESINANTSGVFVMGCCFQHSGFTKRTRIIE